MHSVYKRVQIYVAKDISTSQKAHSNTFQLALHVADADLTANIRETDDTMSFSGDSSPA